MARFPGAAFRLAERRMAAFLAAAGVCRAPIQPYDRLLILLDGCKREPFSLDSVIETVELHRGDVSGK